jgi:hypothetical protein
MNPVHTVTYLFRNQFKIFHLLLCLPRVLFPSRFRTKMYIIHSMHATFLTSLIHHDLICRAQTVNRDRNIHEDAVTVQCTVFQILSIALTLFESTFRNLSVNIMRVHWCRVSRMWSDNLTPTGSSHLASFAYAALSGVNWFYQFGQSRIILPEDGDRFQLRNVWKKNYADG